MKINWRKISKEVAVENETKRMLYMPPEIFNPELAKPRKRRVLLLASYCGEDDAGCTEEKPCNECLRICNVAEVVVGVDDVVGQFELSSEREG